MKKKWKLWPIWLKTSIIVFLILLTGEILLRLLIGLGDLPVYREDKNYEYFYKSNQDVWRYGNHITTNEFGMRSKKIDGRKKITILEFGDSILNGGAHVDQDSLATSIEEEKLNLKYSNQVQVLNVSAQSWGVSNAFAFLKKHGDFNSNIILLVFSSHDLNDNMHFRKVVGVHPAWPNTKPLLALTDVWSRYIWPGFKRTVFGDNEYEYLRGFDDSKTNPGWNDFFRYSAENNKTILVYLHASIAEVKSGKYDSRGKEIIKMCREKNIEPIVDLNVFRGNLDAFIDDMHLNEKGHRLMAGLLIPKLEKEIRAYLEIHSK